MSALFSLSATVLGQDHVCSTPVWQDEFNDDSLDTDKWQIELGDGCDQDLCGWGNNELQWYQAENLELKHGHLRITGMKNALVGDKNNHQFTSAKITTKNRFSQRYGRFEARLKLPGKPGTWPAFWMMPENKMQTWPVEGEIDIVEQGGRKESDFYEILGSLHFGKAWPDNAHISHVHRRGEKWADAFHVFAVDWNPNQITWSINGETYAKSTPNDLLPNEWPFNQKSFYLILNLAIGGTLGGAVEDTFSSANLIVDYVRIYQHCS